VLLVVGVMLFWLSAAWLIFALVGFFGAVIATLVGWENEIRYWIACGLVILGTGAYLLVSVWCFLLTMRKYSVSREGIRIQYPLCKPVFYPWEQISDVGICNVHYNTKGPLRHQVVLRIVIGPEDRGPKQGLGSWTGWGYELRHMQNVITLSYNSRRLLELEKLCPMGVADYRHIKRVGSNPV
jgi:hypothetical protein